MVTAWSVIWSNVMIRSIINNSIWKKINQKLKKQVNDGYIKNLPFFCGELNPHTQTVF